MQFDFLVIGSGIAGLSFARKAAKLGNVCVITKKEEADTATNLAQGGIAAVLGSGDSFEKHVSDTLEAGDGLCDPEVVSFVVKNGPEQIQELVDIGVNFAIDEEGKLNLGKEGGHSERRVAHSYDLTGKEIERALMEGVHSLGNVTLYENHMCVDLIIEESIEGKKRCRGAYVINDQSEIIPFIAKVVVLCTGGAGKVYLYTSNPDIATGDGVAISHRAGAHIKHMEFVQFHPTCLFHHRAKNFLISEAVRGEGAKLFNEKGERFLKKYEPEVMELATRDKVARAIDSEMKKSGSDCVYLDISEKGRDFLQKRFPTIHDRCLSLGINIAKDPIPVVPAAHYLCGGVVTDMNGLTSIENLFALGETACTGLHGGNRLASNSLLEAVVFSNAAYNYCRENWAELSEVLLDPIEEYNEGGRESIDEEILINHNWDIIRRVMWNYVGIVRRRTRLKRAAEKITEARKEIDHIIRSYKITPNMLELRNISLVADLIIQASLHRNKSQGLHYIIKED